MLNRRVVLTAAFVLLIVGLITILTGVFGQFFANADSTSAATLTGSELSTVQSFMLFGGSMIATSFVLFVLLNRLD